MSSFVAPQASTDISCCGRDIRIYTGATRPVPGCLNQYHVETRDNLAERDKDVDMEIARKRMEASCNCCPFAKHGKVPVDDQCATGSADSADASALTVNKETDAYL